MLTLIVPTAPVAGGGPRPLEVSRARRAYWKVFLIGLALNYVAMKLLAASGNPNLVPTVIFLGAFLDLVIPQLQLPIQGLQVVAIGVWVLVELLREGNRREEAARVGASQGVPGTA